jgi:hypothetical protein
MPFAAASHRTPNGRSDGRNDRGSGSSAPSLLLSFRFAFSFSLLPLPVGVRARACIGAVIAMARAASFLQPAHLQLLQRHREPDQTLSLRLASLISLNQPYASSHSITFFLQFRKAADELLRMLTAQAEIESSLKIESVRWKAA